MNYSFTEGLGILLIAFCRAFILGLILSLPVLWIWNSTMPELFGFHEITWWTAWKLSFLSNIFFKSLSYS